MRIAVFVSSDRSINRGFTASAEFWKQLTEWILMKKFLMILFLSVYGLGQAVLSGRGVSSGFSSIGQAQQGGGFVPALPAIWVDNNEALDGVNCGGQCSGAGFVAPAYELTLPNTWTGGLAPPGCSFGNPYWTGTPTSAQAGAGLQHALTDIEACRTQHNTAVILDLPVLAGIGYSTTNGITIDSTATSLPTQFNVVRSTTDSTLATMPEPVCAGGMQDNVAAATGPGVINSDCAGDHVAYQLGTTVYCANGAAATGNNPQSCSYTGAFTLANGAATNTSAYNYAQYMPQITCTAHACTPLAFCNADGSSNNPCSSTTVSAGFWAFYDLAIGPCPASSGCDGASNDNFVISVGNGQRATSTAMFNQHIHFRRIWVHGDWTDLTTGENSIAGAFSVNAGNNWSIVGSQVSQALRPGGEGHAVSVGGITGKIVNNWLEGQSSGIFAGGESLSRTIAAYIANTDMEIGQNRETFPLGWLGSMCSGTPPNGGNACGNIPDSNFYWGGAGANHVNTPSCVGGPSEPGVVCVDVSSDGLTVSVHGGNWPAGMPPFHDSTTAWDVGHQAVYLNAGANKCGDGTQTCKINTMGPGICSAWPASTGCPTSLTLQTAVVGAPLTNIPFASFSNSIVRKNCHEFKEGARVAYYGNICENVDNSGGQNGINFANAIRSISGTPTGRNYYADLHDVTVQGSIFRNSCNGFTNAGGRSAGSGSGDGVSWSMRTMSFTDILGYNISGTNPGCGPSDFGIRTSSALQQWTVTITENHGNGTNGDHATASATCISGECPIGYEAFNILAGEPVFITNTGSGCAAFVQPAPQTAGAGIGPLASAGSARWEAAERSAFITGATYNSGTKVGTIISTLNPGTGSVSINGVNPGNTGSSGWNGDWTVTTSSGSQFTIDMSGAGTPLTYISGGVAQQILAGSYPWPTLTVTYPWVAAADTVDSTGTCQLTNQQGDPSTITYNHLTLVTDSAYPLGAGPAPANGAPYLRNLSVLNSIFMGGGWYNPSVANPKEGKNTEVFVYDVTSMAAHHLVWPGRSAYSSQYVEYGNNAAFPDPGCTGAGCSNPTPTIYFPAASCSGVGFNFSCSTLPLIRNDYHDFAQASGGAFHNVGSDGTDIGARIPIIDSMMTVTKYACGTSCGNPGPFTR